MKEFVVPEIEDMSNLMLEPVYAASGWTPPPEKDKTPGDWDMSTSFCNHNTGSHSELKITCSNYGSGSGDNIEMKIVIKPGYEIDSYTLGDSCLSVKDYTPNGFTLVRSNRHFNPGENVGFVIQVKAKASQYHGSYGKTGEYMASPFEIVSYNVY